MCVTKSNSCDEAIWFAPYPTLSCKLVSHADQIEAPANYFASQSRSALSSLVSFYWQLWAKIRIETAFKTVEKTRRFHLPGIFPGKKVQERRGGLGQRKFPAQDTRRRVEQLFLQTKRRFRRKMKAVNVRVVCVRIFFVAWFGRLRRIQQDLPDASGAEQALARGFLPSDQNLRALRTAANFKRDRDYGRGVKRSGRIIVRKGSEKGDDFRRIRGKAFPPVAITVVHDGAGAKNLLQTGSILSRNAHDHVRELGKSKRLPHHRAHGHIARVFFCEAHRDGFRKWHEKRIAKGARRNKEGKRPNAARLFSPALKGGRARDRSAPCRPPFCLRARTWPPSPPHPFASWKLRRSQQWPW